MKIITNIFKIIKSPNFFVPIIICLVLVVIGGLYNDIFQKYMKITLFDIAGIRIDLWSISHLILYIYFGYHFPDYFAEFLIIGTVWEVLESTFFKHSMKRIVKCDDNSKNLLCQYVAKLRGSEYWYGKIDDVGMNMLGFVIGACWSTY